MDKKKTGALIREARIKKNYTQNELGDLIGVSNKAVSRWENGDSFPDIGVLETLSNVLDIPLQDIITGDVQTTEEDAVAEAVRVATIQQKERKRKLLRYGMLVILLLYYAYFGYSALGKNGIVLFDSTIVFYEVSAGVTYAIMLVVFRYKTNVGKDSGLPSKVMKCVSVISLLWGIIVTWVTMSMVTAGKIPFGMKLSSIGPFINNQLVILFLINLIIIGLSVYSYEAKDEQFGWENYVSAAVVHITILYGLLLHKLSTIEGAINNISTITCIVIVLLVIYLIAFALKKKKAIKSVTKNI